MALRRVGNHERTQPSSRPDYLGQRRVSWRPKLRLNHPKLLDDFSIREFPPQNQGTSPSNARY
jgi:hypothetical protein